MQSVSFCESWFSNVYRMNLIYKLFLGSKIHGYKGLSEIEFLKFESLVSRVGMD
jgi:hypothetical protein